MKRKRTERAGDAPGDGPAKPPMRLPGFLTEQDVGLGQVIKRATASLGIRPCGGCERRAAALDRWVVFRGRRGGPGA
jgi:hypothetical protein